MTMDKIAYVLQRYVFTLLYTLVFGILGGFTLAVPALLGGLLVDRLINKEWGNKLYPNSKYYLSIPFILILVYQPLIMGIITPDTNGGLIYSWIMWTQPFAARMAEYFPIIDNYSRQMPEMGGAWLVPAMRHYVAVCWFFNFIFFPIAIVDAIRFFVIVHRNNFYIYAKVADVHKWFKRAVEENPGVNDLGKPKRPLWVLIAATIALYLLSIPILWLFLKYGYWGDEEISKRHFSKEIAFPVFIFLQSILFWGALPFIYFVFGRRMAVCRAKKLLRITNTEI